MKSEQEFLAEIWANVAKIEAEEQHKALARQRHHSLIQRTILLQLTVGVSFLILILLHSHLDFTTLTALCGVYLVLGYLWEGRNHEYRNQN
ncbi:hypothetical protein [Paenibacillus donghaensis]|uniref:Uncharacterized protein n=1 Tax=Paenibacillus donghaensis TaxID=414771 RepID=A0A2Z2KMR0_9BACL|nr:hypothetical protein [Paenibacillus donghaensis]ASA23839.1 hypothetical protein B9T62_25495 [Paenibacillus donghaensis]